MFRNTHLVSSQQRACYVHRLFLLPGCKKTGILLEGYSGWRATCIFSSRQRISVISVWFSLAKFFFSVLNKEMLLSPIAKSAKEDFFFPLFTREGRSEEVRPLRRSRSRPAESSILSGTPFPQGRGKIVQYLFLSVEIEMFCTYVHKKCCS